MYSKLKVFCSIVCMFLSTTVLHAQDSGWAVNPHGYQYDMTVYGSLVVDGATVTDFENYEIAAFVGDECRGLAEVNSQGEYTWLYLRVRSNVASGETVTFKIYDKTAGKAFNAVETVAFASNGLVGMPSSPSTLTLKRYTLGDVNDDGKINAVDIQRIVLKVRSGESAADNPACDMDENGKLNAVDIQKLAKMVRKK